MTSAVLKTYAGLDAFDRLFGVMIAASAVSHVIFFVLSLIVPPMFEKPPVENIIQIHTIVNNLPKGPKIGTQAPTKTVSAARAPDHTIPWKTKEKELGKMALNKRAPKIKSKRLNYKERRRSEALEKIRKLKEAKEGGGGPGKSSGGHVFSIYLARVKRKLEAAWRLPPGLSPAERANKVRCKIKIGPNGAIVSHYVIRSSGLPHLDRSATAAISAVGTVPPPPLLIQKRLQAQGMVITFDPLRK